MQILLTTLEEIAFNHLMPWTNKNNDLEFYQELMRLKGNITHQGHQKFFAELVGNLTNLGYNTTTDISAEWKLFSEIHRNKRVEALTHNLASFGHYDAKVRFYSMLIAHSVCAAMISIIEQMKEYRSTPLRRQLSDKYVIRLKRILHADVPRDNHTEEDLIILKMNKLGALMIFYLLKISYRQFLHPEQQITHKEVTDTLSGIALADDHLKAVALKVSEEYLSLIIQTEIQPPHPYKKAKVAKQEADVATQKKQTQEIPTQQTDKENSPSANVAKPNGGIGEVESKNDIMSAAEVMKMLGVNKTTLKRYRDRQGLPHHRPVKGGKIFYYRSEILAWIEQNQALVHKNESNKN
jgi:predicted DNA-binding transcriptional regulator AlpA